MKTTITPESLADEMEAKSAAFHKDSIYSSDLRLFAGLVRALAAAPVAEKLGPVGRDAALQLAQAATVAASLRGEGMRALNQHRMSCGHSIAYVDDAFESVAAELEAKVAALLGEAPRQSAKSDGTGDAALRVKCDALINAWREGSTLGDWGYAESVDDAFTFAANDLASILEFDATTEARND